MPLNPTPEQSKASRRNLRGKEGPKTPGGKARSSANGQKNRGVKTAQARARVIDKRHGLKEDSFYAAANCLTCPLKCPAPSFTNTTPHPSLPLACLERVIQTDPRRCFYHLEGLCLAQGRHDIPPGSITTCVVERRFVAGFAASSDKDATVATNRELVFRKRMIRLITEAKAYLLQLRQQGSENVPPHPRLVRVARTLGEFLNRCGSCKYTPYQSPSDWDELLQRASDGLEPTPSPEQTAPLAEAGSSEAALRRSLPVLPS